MRTIITDLTKSIAEEKKAAAAYRARAKTARKLGYFGVARLYDHIAGEEIHHSREYRDARQGVTMAARRKG